MRSSAPKLTASSLAAGIEVPHIDSEGRFCRERQTRAPKAAVRIPPFGSIGNTGVDRERGARRGNPLHDDANRCKW
jgi:hypothetical protein